MIKHLVAGQRLGNGRDGGQLRQPLRRAYAERAQLVALNGGQPRGQIGVKSTAVSPETAAASAGPPPLYGTCKIFAFAMPLK